MSTSEHAKMSAKIADELADEETRRLLGVHVMLDGRVLAICRSCPKKVYDIRRPGPGAFSSGHICKSAEEAEAWFDAHRRTDMHTYYRDDPPMRPAQEQDRVLAQIFNQMPPKPTVIPFPYARSYR